MVVDVWDIRTWKDLRELRKEIREAIFDADDPKLEAVLEAQLKSVEEDLEQGLLLEVPF